MERYWMCNVVMYDYSDSFVCKFILDCTDMEATKKAVDEETSGNGVVLLIDKLYPVTFENIVALKNRDEIEDRNIISRFESMYF